MSQSDERSLFDRIGGQPAIMAAVNRFYDKVMSDELTRPFFSGLNMESQIKKQIAFMAWAFGGPDEYKGRDLTTAHKKLVNERGMSDAHFDGVARHLEATLKELGVAPDLTHEAMTAVAGLRSKVFGR